MAPSTARSTSRAVFALPGLVLAACSPMKAGTDQLVEHVDLFVDASGAPGGTGSSAHPLRTITAALAAVGERTGLHVRVAAGTYDEALGETFPLVIRGISVVGAGAGATVIRGSAPYDTATETRDVTIVTGHGDEETRIADLSVEPARADKTGVGITCDRGTTPKDLGAFAPNTLLEGLHLGGFRTAVIATADDHQAPNTDRGCALRLLGSEVTGNVNGVWGVYSATRDEAQSFEIGDGTEAGRTVFTDHYDGQGNGRAVLVWERTLSARLRGVTISDADGAATAYLRGNGHQAGTLEVSGSSLFGLGVVGVELFGVAQLILEETTLTAIEGTALVVDSADAGAGKGPMVRARGNTFSGNGGGVAIRGHLPDKAQAAHDFGTAGDPGRNTFRCNSGRNGLGEDVSITLDDGATGTIALAGDDWDHAPPTEGEGGGVDLGLHGVGRVDVDVSSPELSTLPCPAGRIP